MMKPDEDGVLAVVAASPGRRLLACGVIYTLGILGLYVTFSEPPSPALMVFMVVLGVAALILGDQLRRATQTQILLTEDALISSDGTVIARLEDVVSVDRGAFAFKPSNGFTLKLKTKQPRSWAPGLWWRLGRYVGVGGVVSAGQAKLVAETIVARTVSSVV